MKRREFVRAGAAAGIAAAAPRVLSGQTPPKEQPAAPTMLTPRTVKPVVIASSNGHQYKNGGNQTTVELAFSQMLKGGDLLDALIAGVNLCELDPEDTSVGYGGLPNAEGIVQLDASVMHGPKKRAGSVGALEGIRTPSLVAKAVMEQTDHHLIVGKDAQRFARTLGFKVEDDLNTDKSRKAWLEWKRRTDPSHYLEPEKREAFRRRVELEMIAEGWVDAHHFYGTINCDGVSPKGEICGTTTTSGLAWKIPGRLGDSPILGAGLYVDGAVGAAGSTGRGEANLYGCSSFLVVEQMRRGMHPKDAGMEALRRIKANTVEKRLINAKGQPNFNVNFYAVNAKGEYAGVALYGSEKSRFAVCTEGGGRLEPIEPLLDGAATDE